MKLITSACYVMINSEQLGISLCRRTYKQNIVEIPRCTLFIMFINVHQVKAESLENSITLYHISCVPNVNCYCNVGFHLIYLLNEVDYLKVLILLQLYYKLLIFITV